MLLLLQADDDDWEQERPIEEDTWQRQPIDEDILKSLFKGGPTIDEETTENKLTYSAARVPERREMKTEHHTISAQCNIRHGATEAERHYHTRSSGRPC